MQSIWPEAREVLSFIQQTFGVQLSRLKHSLFYELGLQRLTSHGSSSS